MATLVYCELCGVLIKGPQSHAPIPEGVICDGCFESRRAVVTTTEPVAPDSGAMVQFNCCYCYSLLRLKAVAKRTRIKCPKCADAFYLNPDGRLESRLEGNTTAIISPDQVLRPLTPTAGVAPLPQGDGASKTQPIRRDDTPALSKTQPMSRDLLLPAAKQQALLDELQPKKHPSFLDDVPSRDAASAAASMIDTDRFEGKSLDLLPDDVGPGDARKTPKNTPALRPSEEGRVDLDADGLRRKTAKYQQKQLLGKHTTKRRKQAEAPETAEDEPKKERPREREKDKAKDEQKREERERRAAEAQRKGQELESQRSKKSLGALSLAALCVLPTILTVLLLTMTTRGTGFATRGAFGERMKDVGGAVDRGVRSLGGIVNPYLPPEYRLPQVAPR